MGARSFSHPPVSLITANLMIRGQSSPYIELSTTNLKYLTIEQSVQDMVNFARNCNLSFDYSGSSNSDEAPWIFVGGSYAGSLVAWTEILAPGTFWAYHSASAPLQAITDFVRRPGFFW